MFTIAPEPVTAIVGYYEASKAFTVTQNLHCNPDHCMTLSMDEMCYDPECMPVRPVLAAAQNTVHLICAIQMNIPNACPVRAVPTMVAVTMGAVHLTVHLICALTLTFPTAISVRAAPNSVKTRVAVA